MTIICNVTGSERKHMVQVLAELLQVEPIYTKAPTFAYILGDYQIDKDGTIHCPESASVEDAARIYGKLTEEGFTPEIEGIESVEDDISDDAEVLTEDDAEDSDEEAPTEIPAEMPDLAPDTEAEGLPEAEAPEANEGAETPETAAEFAEDEAPMESTESDDVSDSDDEDATKLTISIPRDKLTDDALVRLRTMVSNKAVLFQRALLTDTLPIEESEETVSFPWFTLTGTDGEAEAYGQFITHLCKMATEQTRVLDKPYDGDNDRFAMRIFMVRLGMKGAQFALARKLMMKNLSGNSGWRYGAPPKKAEVAVPTEEQRVSPEIESEVMAAVEEAISDGVASLNEETADEPDKDDFVED